MAERGFPTLLVGATLIMVGLCGSLLWVGRHQGVAGGEPTAPDRAAPVATERPARARIPLDLIPARAWLVVDFSSSLVNARPFGNDSPPCDQVSAPERVAFAVVPNSRGELSFFLTSVDASPGFVACAQKKILASGGRVAPSRPELVVLESPAGVFLHERGQVVFSTSGPDRPMLEGLLEQKEPSVLRLGPHAAALDATGVDGSLLRASLELPEGWLTQLGPEYARSPLAALHGATLTLTRIGGARGQVRCEAARCVELQRFAERALGELSAQAPPHLAGRLREALETWPPSPEHPGEFAVALSPGGVDMLRGLLASWATPSPLP